MFEQAEWKLLRKYLESSDVTANRQDASQRLLMYWVAIETGLRSKELRSLTRADIVVSGSEPHVLCSSSNTKNRKDAQQFISDELAKRLKKFVANKLPTAEVFIVGDETAMAEVLRDDCVEAGIKNTDVLDFHCLRHTTGSWLAAAGIPLHEVQRIMRHSSITLTIDRYGHLAKGSESRNRNVLGKMLG